MQLDVLGGLVHVLARVHIILVQCSSLHPGGRHLSYPPTERGSLHT